MNRRRFLTLPFAGIVGAIAAKLGLNRKQPPLELKGYSVPMVLTSSEVPPGKVWFVDMHKCSLRLSRKRDGEFCRRRLF